MMERFFSAVGREVRGMHEAAYLLAGFALLSQVLALVRDRVLAANFGASHTLDLYYAAFRIPDFLFATVASLLSLYALLPVLSKLEHEHKGLMASFLQEMLLVFFVTMGFLSAVLFILAPWIVPLTAPGIASGSLILLVRILLLQPIFLGLSNTVSALTQMRHRFILYSISPLLYNLGIIFGALELYPRFGVAGLGWGVVIGACLHFAVQAPFFFAEKAGPRMPLGEMFKELRTVLGLSIPRTLALAANQISLLVLVAIVSFFSAGSIAVFTFAYNLQAVPLTIIGISYSIAAFPTLARLHTEGKQGEFVQYIETALRHILFWAIPTTIFMIVMRAQLVRIILGAGAFTWDATRLTAAALALFIIALAAQCITLLIARAYYAAGNTRKPLYWGVIDVVVSIVFALALIALFHESNFFRSFMESLLRVSDVPGTTVLMISFAYALGSIAEFAVGYIVFVRDFKIPNARVWALVCQSFAASVIGAGASYLVLTLTGATGTINKTLILVLQSALAGTVGLLVTVVVLALLKNQELAEAFLAFKRRFEHTPQVAEVAIEATDVSS